MTDHVFETCGDLYLDLPSARARAEKYLEKTAGTDLEGMTWSDILVGDSGCTWRASMKRGPVTFVVDVVQRFLR